MRKTHIFGTLFTLLLSVAVLFPVIYVAVGAIRDPRNLYQVFIRQPFYLYKFWKTLALGIFVVFVHAVISCMGGYAFAKFRFRWKRGLYFLMIVLMMMPVQVTLVPSYIILDKLNLLDSWTALALPCIFSPFGTVLMTQVFRSVSDEILDAAKVDGADTWQTLWQILAPAARGGLVSLVLLTFVDVWNMVEQPMVFLQDSDNFPLSVFLAVRNDTNTALSFAGGLLAMIPVLLLFLYFKDELAEGIEFTGVK